MAARSTCAPITAKGSSRTERNGRIPAKLGYARLGERLALDLWPAAPGETGTDVVWQFTASRPASGTDGEFASSSQH